MNELLAGFGQYFASPPNAESKEVLAHIDKH